MRQWRVGTFSMGILLLATGILLLYGQLQPYPATEYLLQWWPLIFVLLGLEVLLQAYFNKVEDGESRVRYFQHIHRLYHCHGRSFPANCQPPWTG